MKKEVNILLAGGIGFLAVLGALGLRKIIARKKQDNYNDYYSDFESITEDDTSEDDHGIEFYAMK